MTASGGRKFENARVNTRCCSMVVISLHLLGAYASEARSTCWVGQVYDISVCEIALVQSSSTVSQKSVALATPHIN